MKKLILSTVLSVLTTTAMASDSIPECAYDAAEKYGAPQKVFKALVLAERDSPNIKDSKHYGSMNMYELIVPHISEETAISEADIKNDECSGYYAASWLLMNSMDGDIWDAVYTYYYGFTDRFKSKPVKVEHVRKIYESL